MPRRTKKILPIRNGVGPSKIILREPEIGKELFTALIDQGKISHDELITAFNEGNIVDIDGVSLPKETYISRVTPIFIYRTALPEKPVPYPMPILEANERFIIVDKPPFLASIPRGMHISETALVRARDSTGIDTLSPAHRLDRLTSGLLLFTTTPLFRGKYQNLFAHKKITKIYHALSHRPDQHHGFPIKLSSRIEKTPGVMRAYEVPGTPNAHTVIDYLGDHPSGYGEYVLTPLTGKTHQLRLHMSKIGLPIIGDPLYPQDLNPDSTDFSTPLQLRAHTLEFIDPITNTFYSFTSQQSWILDSIPHIS